MEKVCLLSDGKMRLKATQYCVRERIEGLAETRPAYSDFFLFGKYHRRGSGILEAFRASIEWVKRRICWSAWRILDLVLSFQCVDPAVS